MQQAQYKEQKLPTDRKAVAKADKPGKKKSRMSKGSKILLTIVCIVVGIALALAITVLILNFVGRSKLTNDGSDMRLHDQAENIEAGRVRYKGQLYQYKNDISTILLMGVDSKEKSESEGEFGESNQADAIVLTVLDPSSKKITLISVSRDSMCDFEILDENGASLGSAHAQLALSYAYGDGGDISCQLTTDAVSKLCYDLPISAYASIYMNGIAQLCSQVGGVTVTPEVSFKQFVAGQPVKIDSSNAETYLRYRDSTVEGNNGRMERQKAVIMELAKTMLRTVRQNPSSILTIYDSVSRNVTTNLDAASMVYLARVAASMSLNNDVQKVPGTSTLGEYQHAEFNVDETALYELILEIFYEPIDG